MACDLILMIYIQCYTLLNDANCYYIEIHVVIEINAGTYVEGGTLFAIRQFVTSFEAFQHSVIAVLYFLSQLFSYIALLLLYGK